MILGWPCLADTGLAISDKKARRATQQSGQRKGASVSQLSLLKDNSALHKAAAQESAASQCAAVPGQDCSSSGGNGVPDTLFRQTPAQGSKNVRAHSQSSSAGLHASSIVAHDKEAYSGRAKPSREEQYRSASALPALSDKVLQAGTYTEHLLSVAAGADQVVGESCCIASSAIEGAAAKSNPEAMPGDAFDTGKHEDDEVIMYSLSTAESGQQLSPSAPVGEPSSSGEHALSEASGGNRESINGAWPAGAAQHSMVSSKVVPSGCDELRSSGGSMGSYRTGSDLSNSQHESYQGSYPSRPESSGTQGTFDPLNRWGPCDHVSDITGPSLASTELPRSACLFQ